METLFSVSSSFVLMLKDREVFGFADFTGTMLPKTRLCLLNDSKQTITPADDLVST
jgi:hypothetical protein